MTHPNVLNTERASSWLRAAIICALAAGASSAHAQTAQTPDGSLTWNGITLYGAVDVGFQYENHGSPVSDYFIAGTSSTIQKNSLHTVTAINGNNVGQSKIGIKGQENFGNGWSGIFKVRPSSTPGRATQRRAESVTLNNGKSLYNQQTGIDSSAAGQLFAGAAYAGVSHEQFGTLTFGRQNSVLADGIAKYDPMLASQAFSPIGISGVAGGGGDTENRRLNSSLKYEANVASVVHVVLQYQPTSGTNYGSTTEAALGWNFPGGSVDVFYAQKNSAISSAALSAAALGDVQAVCNGAVIANVACGSIDKSVAATISDNTTEGVMGSYHFLDAKATVSAGFERIQYKTNTTVQAGSSTIGGYILATVNNTAFPSTKTLDISWIGLRYDLTPKLTLARACSRYNQNSYSTANPGCSTNTSGECSGSENFVSAMADYHFTKRFDGYAGIMWSQVNGGLAAGFAGNLARRSDDRCALHVLRQTRGGNGRRSDAPFQPRRAAGGAFLCSCALRLCDGLLTTCAWGRGSWRNPSRSITDHRWVGHDSMRAIPDCRQPVAARDEPWRLRRPANPSAQELDAVLPEASALYLDLHQTPSCHCMKRTPPPSWPPSSARSASRSPPASGAPALSRY